MTLERWIALVFVLFSLGYGYLAFVTMDQLLPPFMQRNPIWPSTFPKALAILGVIVGMAVIFGPKKMAELDQTAQVDINYRRLHEYKLGQALALLFLMVIYAICLRPVGFLISTSFFLILGSTILGERKWFFSVPISVVTATGVWYLVQQVLGIYLRPFPFFMGN